MTAAVPDPRFRDQLARLEDFVREWDDGERDYYQIGEDITDLLRWWLPTVSAELARVQAAANQRVERDELLRQRMAEAAYRNGWRDGQRAAALASPAPAPHAEEGQR